jgi:hypothetical protein
MLTTDLLRVKRAWFRPEPRQPLVIGHSRRSGQLKAVPPTGYFLAFLAFFGPAFFEGVGFFAIGFAPPRLPENADSQPSEYF